MAPLRGSAARRITAERARGGVDLPHRVVSARNCA
jgi:hypothetical protein